jgi:hypothetical protein
MDLAKESLRPVVKRRALAPEQCRLAPRTALGLVDGSRVGAPRSTSPP